MMKHLTDTQPTHSKKYLITHLDIISPQHNDRTDYAIVIDQDMILDIGESSKLQNQYKDFEVIDGRQYIATPGFINCHTHAPLSFFRGLGHGQEAMIENFLFPAEKSLTLELIEPLSWPYLLSGIKSGVTTFADHYYFISGVASAIDKLGARGVLGETVADLGGAFPDQSALERQRLFLQNWQFSNRITPSIAPHAADTVSPQLFKSLVKIAQDENLPLHFHLSQTTGELERVLKREKKTPVEYAYELGALHENTLAVHLVTANDNDIKLLKKSGCTVGFCPASQIIYEKLSPIKSFLEYDLPIAIGTDCAASNDSGDILAETKLAGLLAMDRRGHKAPLTTDRLLEMITTIPAKTFNLNLLGKIEKGYKADIVFIKKNIETQPHTNLKNNLIYSISSNNVEHVMVDGRWILWNKNPTLFSESDMLSATEAAMIEIKKRVKGIR